MSTRRCRAEHALRMRVSMSATGSVIDIYTSLLWLPARLAHARDLALQREVSEADAAQPELAQHGTRAPAALTPRVDPHLELRLLLAPLDPRLLRHCRYS